MRFSDVFSLAFRSLRSNKLRTGITIVIIAFGIMALVGIITAIAAMNQKLTESFSTMGANGFTIQYKERNIQFGRDDDLKVSRKSATKQRISNLDMPITEAQAEQFINLYRFPAVAGISTFGGGRFTVSFQSRKTNPTVFLFGTDENYLDLNGFTLEAGRNFTRQDIQNSESECQLGYDVAMKLFKKRPSAALGQIVRINDIPFRVIGVLASRGSTFGFSRDNIALVGYKSARKYFGMAQFTIGVKVNNISLVNSAMGEAEGLFRAIRKLQVTDESNFVLERSNSIAEKAMSVLGFLTAAVIIIGFITLVGSSIGLMNIMLVSVTERTKEVGLVKAIGGKRKAVQQQFLIESILISFFGALLGIVLGVIVGNLFALLLQTGFIVPWMWVFFGIVICSLVGLIAGLYPALKAGKLNPIEALRYE
jgi:putative ABC transport system permease protein